MLLHSVYLAFLAAGSDIAFLYGVVKDIPSFSISYRRSHEVSWTPSFHVSSLSANQLLLADLVNSSGSH